MATTNEYINALSNVLPQRHVGAGARGRRLFSPPSVRGCDVCRLAALGRAGGYVIPKPHYCVSYARKAATYCIPTSEWSHEKVWDSNVPAPTPSQRREVRRWLQANGWRYSKREQEWRKQRAEGFIPVGSKRAFKKLWTAVHTVPRKGTVPRDDIPRGVITATSVKQQKRRHHRDTAASDKSQEGLYQHKLVRTRSAILALRLRILILRLKQRRLKNKVGVLHYLECVEGVCQGLLDGKITHNLSTDVMSGVQGMVDKAVGSLKDAIGGISMNATTMIATVGSTIATAAAGNSVRSWLVGAGAVLVQLGILTANNVINVTQDLEKAGARPKQPVPSRARAESYGYPESPLTENEDAGIRAATTLWQAISTFVGTSNTMRHHKDADVLTWSSALIKEVRSASTASNGLLTMFKNIWIIIRNMYDKAIKWISKPASQVIELYECAPALKELCDEACTILEMDTIRFVDPNEMARLSAITASINQIMLTLMEVPMEKRDTTIFNHFSRLQSRLQAQLVECKRYGFNTLTRPTPLVLYFVGSPGIGKSEMTNHLIAAIFKKLDEQRLYRLTTRNVIYTKQTASAYWDSYNCEPAIVFDDFAQITHSNVEHTDVANLMLLKSSAVFRPPMAAVNDKGRLACPQIVLCHANTPFPQSSAVASMDALWRRRDIMFRVEMRANASVPNHSSPYDPKFSHLMFSRYVDPRQENSPTSAGFSFDDMVDYCTAYAVSYFRMEMSKVAAREEALNSLFSGEANPSKTPLTYDKLVDYVAAINAQHEIVASMTPSAKEACTKSIAEGWDKFVTNYLPFFKKEREPPSSVIADMVTTDNPQVLHEMDCDLFAYQAPLPDLQDPTVFRGLNARQKLILMHRMCQGRAESARAFPHIADDVICKPFFSSGYTSTIPSNLKDQAILDLIETHKPFVGLTHPPPPAERAPLHTPGPIFQEPYERRTLDPETPYRVHTSRDWQSPVSSADEAEAYTEKLQRTVREFLEKTNDENDKAGIACSQEVIQEARGFPEGLFSWFSEKPVVQGEEPLGESYPDNLPLLVSINKNEKILNKKSIYQLLASSDYNKCIHAHADLAHLTLCEKLPMYARCNVFKKIADASVKPAGFKYVPESRMIGLFPCHQKNCILLDRFLVTHLRIYMPVFAKAIKDADQMRKHKPEHPAVVAIKDMPMSRFFTVPTLKDLQRLIYTMCSKVKIVVKTLVYWVWHILKWASMILIPLLAIAGIGYAGYQTVKYYRTPNTDDEPRVPYRRYMADRIRTDYRSVYDRAADMMGRSSIPDALEVDNLESSPYVVRNVVVRPPQPIARPESGTQRFTEKHLRRATVFLMVEGYMKDTNELVSVPFRGFAIAGPWILIPKHYLYQIENLQRESAVCEIFTHSHKVKVNPFSFKFKSFKDSEFCLIFHPHLQSQFKDMRKHIRSLHDWANVPMSSQVRIYEVNGEYALNTFHVSARLQKGFTLQIDDIESLYLDYTIQYRWNGPGRCMSVVCDTEGFIRGFHIAGANGFGYAEVVSQETFAILPETPVGYDQLNIPHTRGVESPIDGTIIPVAEVESPYRVGQYPETKIIPSQVHGVFPVRTKPAPLKPCYENNFTDPMRLGVEKHGKPCLGFSAGAYESAEHFMRTMLTNVVKPRWADPQVRPVSMAVLGVPATPCFKPMELSTSEGFPYMCERPPNGHNKHWLINVKIDDISFHPRLTEIMSYKQELREKGIVPSTVFVDCLKDARLTLEKCRTPGKVRIFSVSPTDFIIQYRMYFADFIVSYVDALFEAGHGVGMTVEGPQWTRMYQYLMEVGTKFLCGDYKNFGPAFDLRMHEIANRLIREWYEQFEPSEVEQLVRMILHKELETPLHLCNSFVYRTMCGMPSGSPVTTITNSMVNTLYVFAAWHEIMYEFRREWCSYDIFLRHVRFVTFGDDLIMCVSDEAIDLFNNITLSQTFARAGIEYTDDSKQGVDRPYVSISETSFLKRTPAMHPYIPRMLIGMMDPVSIEDCANWIHKSPDPLKMSVEASYACLLLAYTRGPNYFHRIRQELVAAWRQIEYPFTPREWDEIDYCYFGNIYASGNFSVLKHQLYSTPRGLPQAPPANPTQAPEDETVCNESQDTILQEHDDVQVICDPALARTMEQWCGMDIDESYNRLLDRELLIDRYTWDTSRALGDLITDTSSQKSRIPLPYAVLKHWRNTPSALPFMQYRYMRSDMEITVSINANKFMCGQIQVSWYYSHHLDNDYSEWRQHLVTRSQMISGVLDVGTSGTCTLCIPFRSYRPWLHIAERDDMESPAMLGELQLRVLSPLQATSTSANACTVSVFSKFKNARFMGLVSRDLNALKGNAEMLSTFALYAGMKLFDKWADTNRDKPPAPHHPMLMTPNTTGSLATGTGCAEPIQSMRLDCRGMTPHPDGVDNVTSFTHIAQHKGLLKGFKWSVDASITTPLCTIPCEPLFAIGKSTSTTPGTTLYASKLVDEDNAIWSYGIPPCGVVAGLFSYWRGSLEFEFHVVGSAYHTGRLLVAYVPHYDGNVTFDQAQAGPYVVFDIHTQRCFTFITPYIADKPWWPCQGVNGDDTIIPAPPGKLHVFVLNKLVKMDNVPSEINILIYMRAHSSFEISVPRQSSLVLPWDAEINPKKSEFIRATDGYAPWYCGYWRNFVVPGKTGLCCLRYGPGADHIAQFPPSSIGDAGPNGGWYYYVLDPSDKNYELNSKLLIKLSKSMGGSKASFYLSSLIFIPLNVDDGYGTIYMAVAFATDSLQSDRPGVFGKRFTDDAHHDWQYVLYSDDDENPYCLGNPKLLKRKYSNSNWKPALRDEFVYVGRPEVDDFRLTSLGIDCGPSPVVIPTACGLNTFGENFGNVKDYLRRYVYVDEVPFKYNAQTFNEAICSIPVTPVGLDLSKARDGVTRYNRDAGHTIVASGYRFFRGSMNYKIVFPTPGICLWFQHRPDRHIINRVIERAPKNKLDCHFLKNYATVIQSAANAPAITFNIPFYQPGSFGLLQRSKPDASVQARRAMSLGECVIGILGDEVLEAQFKGKRLKLQIYNSVGDDMQYFQFTGFPFLVPIQDLNF